MSPPEKANAPHQTGTAALVRVMSDIAYRNLFLASAAVMASQWMQRIALGWIMWELTGSTAWLGLLASAELLPGLFFGPLGGVLSDRIDRKRIVLICQSAALVVSVVTGAVVFLGLSSPLLLVGLTAAGGILAALQESARTLLQRDATPRDCLPTGMSMTAISVNVTRFLGPALAGPLVIWPGPASIFWINAVVALVMIAAVLSLTGLNTTSGAGSRQPFLRQLWSGFQAASNHPVVTPVLVIFAATAFLIRPVYELMPAFADRLFGGNVQDYSYLIMGVGAGAVVGAVIVTLNAPSRPAMMFFWSSLAACLSLIGFAATPDIIWATLAATVLGFFMCISAATSQLVMVLDTEESVSGRVLSLWGALMRGAPALGALATGTVLDMMGYRLPLALSGALAAGFTALAIFLFTRRPMTAA
ncbi:MFS transporter [Hyphomonas sp. WL0036]|uniref:MFS transporter n=1 Tax=Hyphomonas sediminis TaxID=2866160 RepID=UPI001C80C105|nr:MFS transporter [Hyphomonas sediminis]MBY9067228.1 MFS transporter [Hyphomonas sediminis]